ncbi:efflux RND transporter permease subunit [Acetobacter thailandicus]|uniref:Efflux RND transporter permease subunit n=1 Tax=Acetobacter thailandicus TaxID=1502842 RepID=A0ABT3QE58_9PROT|nr:efflux RND transporter permease subunit [Acetobacter thailandicus]MCX2563574.1 efflux RND transporter permease subunit [Acetobacter thailandicus]NHN94327.1 MMPL family transporter [Acetobacter thailandicus]
MSPVALCVKRPVGTTLIVIGMILAGLIGYTMLPVASLPAIDMPMIQVSAQQSGGTPEELASTIAEPLERHLGTISGLNAMTSRSVTGQVSISLQFVSSRNVNSAARDVQAAIRAARTDLPTTLRQDPSYRIANTSGMPILVMALTSKTRTPAQLYDEATNVLAQHLDSVSGVGDIQLGGSALPAVRVEMNPLKLYKYGIGFEDIRAALASANANTPKGFITRGKQRLILQTNDQVHGAKDLKGLIVAYRSNRPVHLIDVADVTDSVENVETGGFYNQTPAVLAIVFPRSGTNVVKTINEIRAKFPLLHSALSADVELHVCSDRSVTIRAALEDTQRTLVLSVILVIAVVLLFLRSPRTTMIPAVVIPSSLITTFGVMKLMGYSLDSLSLMALTIATGFVVDDAIVVLENISRHIENGMPHKEAVLKGAEEVAFTVFSVSLSLVAVFFPITMLGGMLGGLLHEFAMTISITVMVSMVLSLTLTPMMCSFMLKSKEEMDHEESIRNKNWLNKISAFLENGFNLLHDSYGHMLDRSLKHPVLVLLSLPATIVIMGILFIIMPKGLFPESDTGSLMAHLVADQSISFKSMIGKVKDVENRILSNKEVNSVVGFLGGRDSANQAMIFIELKEKDQRKVSVDKTVADLRQRTDNIAGAKFLSSVPSLLPGGPRSGNAAYQYTLESDDAATLYHWMPLLQQALQKHSELADISTDIQQKGLAENVNINRDSTARTSLTAQLVANTLYDAYGQRAASVIYNALNQYRVVMNVKPEFWKNADMLQMTWVSTAGGTASGSTQSNTIRSSGTTTTSSSSSDVDDATSAQNSQSFKNQIANSLAGGSGASNGSAVSSNAETMVPLSAIAHMSRGTTPVNINHQGQAIAATLSFNLTAGASINDAARIIADDMANLKIPSSVHGGFAGTTARLQQESSNEPLIILAALLAVYVVLGILYESYVHPITILSTLPSAGAGALLALYLSGQEFDLIGLIGVILLIGIVKKNAIMLVDFAITEEREHGLSAHDAIYQACMLRFRPILMTTLAAALGAVPLVLGNGYGIELRRPLGIAIIGGLALSQVLTLFTTPVVYIYLDRLGMWGRKAIPAVVHAILKPLRSIRIRRS